MFRIANFRSKRDGRVYPIRVSGALKTLLDQDRKVSGVLEDVVGDATARRRRHQRGIRTVPRTAQRNGRKVRNRKGFSPVPGDKRAIDY